MSKAQVPYDKLIKAKESVEAAKRRPKKPMVISDIEKEKLKLIAEKAKKMRIAKNMSYEEFAQQAGINRNTYFRFEQSASSGDNYTVALLTKVIIALDSSFPEFFKDLQ